MRSWPAALQPRVVRARILPAPDALDIQMPPARSCLIVDDGTPLTPALYNRLDAAGWRSVVMSPAWVAERDDVAIRRHVALSGPDEAQITAALAEAQQVYGPLGAFVYIRPRPYTTESDALIHSDDLDAVRAAFLMAKAVQPALAESATAGWGAFMTVTRLDGALGISGSGEYGVVDGGLSGLTKSLRLEWPDVACRALDLDPAMAADAAAEAILAELLDPDRTLAEVAYGTEGRMTLEVTR